MFFQLHASKFANFLTHIHDEKEKHTAGRAFLFGAGSGIRTHVGCPKRFSRPPRYDHFDIPAYELVSAQDDIEVARRTCATNTLRG